METLPANARRALAVMQAWEAWGAAVNNSEAREMLRRAYLQAERRERMDIHEARRVLATQGTLPPTEPILTE